MDTLTIVLIVTAVTICLSFYLHFKPAPYGKFTVPTGTFCSMKINSKLAWIIQECPAFFASFHILISKWNSLSSITIVGLSLFTIHYFQRSFVFPALIKSNRLTPIETCISAFGFCCFNGWLQVRNAIEYDVIVRDNNASLVGLVVFFIGMFINIVSDAHLRELASQRIKNQYMIPTKGLFRYVSAANYFGEIVEWFGFALFLQTPAAAWFSLFSTLFLGQRGFQTHQFYLKKIDNYPKDRSSVFPFSGF